MKKFLQNSAEQLGPSVIVGSGAYNMFILIDNWEIGNGFTVFEKNNQLGGNWVFDENNQHSSVYETTHIISSKKLSEYDEEKINGRKHTLKASFENNEIKAEQKYDQSKQYAAWRDRFLIWGFILILISKVLEPYY